MELNSDVKQHENELRDGQWSILGSKLKKTYENGLLAVCNNSFGVKQGEILGLVGPTGSGKSAILQMMSMEIPVTGG